MLAGGLLYSGGMSNPIYVQQGATLRDTFVYRNATGFVTGKVQADFTLRLTKAGVPQATTGITVAEVTGTGEYSVTVAASSFVAATGQYTLTIYDTSAPAYLWEQTYVVTPTGSSTVAGCTFTAVAGNGRVVSSGTVSGATVAILSGATVMATSLVASDGTWGPVYLNADGTYTIMVQKPNYTTATSTLTVTGGGTTATGPGTDITMNPSAGAGTTDPRSASELWAYFSRMARDVAGTKADTERKQGVQDALDMVAKERQWRWLLRRGFLTLNAAVTGNTCTFTNGSATVTFAGTFPTWMANGKIRTINRIYDVLTRDSATQITLETAWVGTSGSYSTDFFQDEYTLPDNMLWFHQLIPGQWWGWGGSPVSPEDFYRHQSAWIYGQQFPNVWCIHNGKLVVAPYPTISNAVPYTYYARPAALSLSTDIADWDPAQVEVLRRAIDVQVCNRYGSCAGGDLKVTLGKYKEALARAVTTDRAPTASTSALDTIDAYDIPRGDWHRRSI